MAADGKIPLSHYDFCFILSKSLFSFAYDEMFLIKPDNKVAWLFAPSCTNTSLYVLSATESQRDYDSVIDLRLSRFLEIRLNQCNRRQEILAEHPVYRLICSELSLPPHLLCTDVKR